MIDIFVTVSYRSRGTTTVAGADAIHIATDGRAWACSGLEHEDVLTVGGNVRMIVKIYD